MLRLPSLLRLVRVQRGTHSLLLLRIAGRRQHSLPAGLLPPDEPGHRLRGQSDGVRNDDHHHLPDHLHHKCGGVSDQTKRFPETPADGSAELESFWRRIYRVHVGTIDCAGEDTILMCWGPKPEAMFVILASYVRINQYRIKVRQW